MTAKSNGSSGKRRRRPQRPFPAASFKESAEIAEAIVQIAGGAREVRRMTLFDHLGRSPDSGPSRQAITNSARYGLTKGSYKADVIELTDDGYKAVDPDAAPRERARAEFQLAIQGIAPFKALHQRFANNKLPTQQVMRDYLTTDEGLDHEDAKEAVELFIVNAREIGLLRTLSGAERILTLDHLLDLLPAASQRSGPTPLSAAPTTNGSAGATAATPKPTPASDLKQVCFYITPIGEEGTEERQHSDLLLGQIVEPAIEELGLDLQVVRADGIAQPGMISQQILQHVLGARLVVADLSFRNPNVFYELAIRHATGLPTVLISRGSDPIPFDVADLRVVRIDMTDLYSFVPQMEAWRAEVSQQARQAIEQPDAFVTPITLLGGPLIGAPGW